MNPKAFLSPTLGEHPQPSSADSADIDLCWHTHQLPGYGYVRDTIQYVGRFINHDDKVADVTLKRAYDETSTLWALRFGTAYSGCGCPVSLTAEQTLKRVVNSAAVADSPLKFWKRKQRQASISGAKEDIEVLNGSTADERGALCPSTHNRVKVEGSSRVDGARASLFSKKHNFEHPDPFTTYYEYVPRPVPRPGKRRRRSQAPRRGNSSIRSGSSASGSTINSTYWGVAPHSYYGPYGLTNPWCMPVGVGRESYGKTVADIRLLRGDQFGV